MSRVDSSGLAVSRGRLARDLKALRPIRAVSISSPSSLDARPGRVSQGHALYDPMYNYSMGLIYRTDLLPMRS